MMISRRGILQALAAPAIVSAANLMPVRAIERLLVVAPPEMMTILDQADPSWVGHLMTISAYVKRIPDADLALMTADPSTPVGNGWVRYSNTQTVGPDGRISLSVPKQGTITAWGAQCEMHSVERTNLLRKSA